MSKDWGRLWPKYWLQNTPTNYEWDAILNYLLDNHKVIMTPHGTAKVGPLEVWVRNWPYAYGTPYVNGSSDFMPTVRTRKRLRSLIPAIDPLDKVKAIISGS